MMERGQLQLEAMICFGIFLALLAVFLGQLNQAEQQASQALHALKAKTQAELCCFSADIVYTAGSSSVVQQEMHCTGKGNIVESHSGKSVKRAACLAAQIRLVQRGEKSVLEVKANEHYR